MSGASTRPSRSRARAPPPISMSPRWSPPPGRRAAMRCIQAMASCRRTPSSPRPALPPRSPSSARRPSSSSCSATRRAARAHAQKCKVPVLPGTDVTDLAGATAFFRKHAKSGIALKAIAGGGGRGMRLIKSEGEIADAFARAARRGQVGVRQRRPLRRASGRPRAPHRGPDRRRRQRRHRSPGRARVHPAAAQPEDRRTGAQPQPCAGAAPRRSLPLPSPWPRP